MVMEGFPGGEKIDITVEAKAELDGLRRTAASLERSARLSRHFALALGAVGAAATVAFRDAIRVINNFETQVNRVQAAANATTGEIDRLRRQAIRLGRETAFTASQAAEAQFRLAQSGYDVNETLSLMPDVLNVAAAGLLSMEEAGRIVTNQIATFQLGIESATRVSDVLALTAASSKTSISELGTTFRYAAPAAAAVGVSIEETAAAIGILRDRGLVAEQAGTGLRFNILRLVRPVASAAAVFNELGMSQEKVAQQIEEGKLLEVFAEFGKAGLTLNQAGRMFDVRAAGAALILSSAAEEAMELRDALLDSEGASKRMAETQMQGLPGALLRMTSAIESMKIAFGEAGLTDFVVDLANGVRSAANFVSELSDGWKRFILIFGGFTAVAGIVGAAILGIISSIITLRALLAQGRIAKAVEKLSHLENAAAIDKETASINANSAARARNAGFGGGFAAAMAGRAASAAGVGLGAGTGVRGGFVAAMAGRMAHTRRLDKAFLDPLTLDRTRAAKMAGWIPGPPSTYKLPLVRPWSAKTAGWLPGLPSTYELGRKAAQDAQRQYQSERKLGPVAAEFQQRFASGTSDDRRNIARQIRNIRNANRQELSARLESIKSYGRNISSLPEYMQSGARTSVSGQYREYFDLVKQTAAKEKQLIRNLLLQAPSKTTQIKSSFMREALQEHETRRIPKSEFSGNAVRMTKFGAEYVRGYEDIFREQSRANAWARSAPLIAQARVKEAAKAGKSAKAAATRAANIEALRQRYIGELNNPIRAGYIRQYALNRRTNEGRAARAALEFQRSNRAFAQAIGPITSPLQTRIPVSHIAASMQKAGTVSAEKWSTGFRRKASAKVKVMGGTIGGALGMGIGVAAGSVAGAALGEALGGPIGLSIGTMIGAIIGPAIMSAIAMSGPIGWIIAAVGAVTVAVITLTGSWDKLTGAIKRFASNVPFLKGLIGNENTVKNAGQIVNGLNQPLPVAPQSAVRMATSNNQQTTIMQPGAITVNAGSANAEETAMIVDRKFREMRSAENLQTTGYFDDPYLA